MNYKFYLHQKENASDSLPCLSPPRVFTGLLCMLLSHEQENAEAMPYSSWSQMKLQVSSAGLM
jgi:hypothetical protein